MSRDADHDIIPVTVLQLHLNVTAVNHASSVCKAHTHTQTEHNNFSDLPVCKTLTHTDTYTYTYSHLQAHITSYCSSWKWKTDANQGLCECVYSF